MTIQLNAYASFDGDAREAMEHYRDVLGGELELVTFGEYGQAGTPVENLIMHGLLTTSAGLTLMGADAPPGTTYQVGTNLTVMLSGDDEAVLRGYWEGLSAGATITVPLEPRMWGDVYGSCSDQYGLTWQVNIETPDGG